jgi:putative DNA primase/helicase
MSAKVGADDFIASGRGMDLEALPTEDLTDGWPVPVPMPDALPAVPAFDTTGLLPAPLAGWVADIALRVQCPADFVAISAVVAAAAVVGRQCAIRPKQYDDWTVVPNLWGVAVGRPGVLKSPALAEAMKPLNRLIAAASEAHASALRAHTFREQEVKARRDLLQKQLKDTVAKSEPTDALQAQFVALECPAPVPRRYLVNDATVEKLGELLNQNPNGLLLYRDELVGWLRTMDREGHENDRAFYCEAWQGTGGYTYDRVGRGTLNIPAACLSVLGGMQPGPLASYLRETFRGGGQDDGLIQRFQLLVYPDVAATWRNVDRWPDADAKATAVAAFAALDALDPAALGAHIVSGGGPPVLHFTPEAQAVFDAWRAAWEPRVRDRNEPDVLAAHWAKYRSLVPSLALLFHLLTAAPLGTAGPVTAEALARALAWIPYLEAHARRVYHPITHGADAAAGALATKLRAGALSSPFRVRAVIERGWSGLTDREAVSGACAQLSDLGWLRREPVPAGATGGRPTTQYRINPRVIDPARSAP